jgi:hypothetical protein
MDRVDHDRVPRASTSCMHVRCRRRRDVPAVEEPLVVGRVVLLLEAGGETKVGELYVASGVDEDIVRFDVSI